MCDKSLATGQSLGIWHIVSKTHNFSSFSFLVGFALLLCYIYCSIHCKISLLYFHLNSPPKNSYVIFLGACIQVSIEHKDDIKTYCPHTYIERDIEDENMYIKCNCITIYDIFGPLHHNNKLRGKPTLCYSQHLTLTCLILFFFHPPIHLKSL